MGVEPMTRKLYVTKHPTRQNTINIALWSYSETLNYGLVQIEKRLLQHITVIYLKTTFCSFIIIDDAKVEWQCAVFLRSKIYFVFL